jgi:hypothetical protein
LGSGLRLPGGTNLLRACPEISESTFDRV